MHGRAEKGKKRYRRDERKEPRDGRLYEVRRWEWRAEGKGSFIRVMRNGRDRGEDYSDYRKVGKVLQKKV